MDIKYFVTYLVRDIQPKTYNELRTALFDKALVFRYLPKSKVDIDIFSEKLCDYLELFESENIKSIYKQLNSYMDSLDSAVKKYIEKGEKKTKKNPNPNIPRAKKYYSKALEIQEIFKKALKEENYETLFNAAIEYYRIMMCLYSAASEKEKIEDFNYSSKCLDLELILGSLEKEKNTDICFLPDNKYNGSSCNYLFTVVLYYFIKDKEITGDYINE